MTTPNRHADTSDDAKCFEREQLARDRDADRIHMDDLTRQTRAN